MSSPRVPLAAMAIVALLILGLLGGLFHHHKNEKDAAACSYCHSVIQTPVQDLARNLPSPAFRVVGAAIPNPVSRWAVILPNSSTTPRAPPSATRLVLFWESCAVAV
jgi:hypothetical protein